LDTELICCYAKTNDLAAMVELVTDLAAREGFVIGPNFAKIQSIGDRCCNEGLFQAAKVLITSIKNSAIKALETELETVSAAGEANAGERAERGVVLRKTRILER